MVLTRKEILLVTVAMSTVAIDSVNLNHNNQSPSGDFLIVQSRIFLFKRLAVSVSSGIFKRFLEHSRVQVYDIPGFYCNQWQALNMQAEPDQ